MSLILVVLIVIFLLLVFWQFGARLSARYAMTWWLGAVFLFICTAFPSVLSPIARTLGISFVSNLVIAGLLLFLFFQTIELAADLSKSNRLLRKMISEEALDHDDHYKSSHDLDRNTKVLIVLPCFNEEAIIIKTLDRVRRLIAEFPSFDFVVVDDGSSDSTLDILKQQVPGHFLHHKVNVGVAGVLMTGFRYARRYNYSFIVQCDSDGQHPIELIPRLHKEAVDGGCDLLIGSRFVKGVAGSVSSTTWVRVGGIFLLRLSLLLFGKRAFVADPTSGFRVYSRKLVDRLLQEMPDEYPEPETVAIAAMRQLKIGEFPTSMEARTTGVSSISGLRQVRYFAKVTAALIGMRLRQMSIWI